MIEAFAAKLLTSMSAALLMYWMGIPHQIEILMAMQGIDLLMGTLVAWANDEFKPRTLFRGILLKAVAYPFLAACDLTEGPLRLSFHVDGYVALTLVAYEFLSIVETYAKVRPLPRFVASSAKTVQEWLSAPKENGQKIKETE